MIIGKDPGYLTTATNGRVAEWLMAPVLKTGVPERVSGVRIPSLPPHLSLLGGHRGGNVPSHIGMFVVKICVVPVRRDGRVAEGARLESVYRLIPYRGFESPSLRHFFSLVPLAFLPPSLHSGGRSSPTAVPRKAKTIRDAQCFGDRGRSPSRCARRHFWPYAPCTPLPPPNSSTTS